MHTELAYEAQKTLIKERSNTSLARRAQLVRGRPRPRPAIAIRVPGWRRVRIVVNRWQSGDVVLPGSQGEQAREPFGEPQPAERYIGIVRQARVGMTAAELDQAIGGER